MKHDSDNSKSTHTIRLRGPCRLLWMHNGTQQAEARVQIPCKIEPNIFDLPSDFEADSFVLQRNFGMPTGLAKSQNVLLELAKFEGAVRAVLNRDSDNAIESEFLASEDSVSMPVTSALLQHNTLEVEIGSLPAVAGEIQLVIEE